MPDPAAPAHASPEPSSRAGARVVLLVLEGGADPAGPSTPLHEAGTPALDRVARDGHLARAVLDATSCWDGFTRLLGADGDAGLGPAEACAARLGPGDGGGDADGDGIGDGDGNGGARWAARVDLVTVDDDRILDPFGGRIADPEASALFDEVSAALPHGRLVRLPGRRGLWLGTEPIPDAPPPWEVGNRAPRAVLAGAPPLLALYEASRRALSLHDVNAVRVDLGENPANALWAHGAGPLPLRMAPPAWAAGRRAALICGGGPGQGLARALGWDGVAVDGDDDALCAATLDALADHDVVVVRTSSVLAAGLAAGDAAHAARVEAFSAVDARLVGPVLGALEERGPFVLAVAADGVYDAAAGAYSAEPVPCGVLRAGGRGHGLPAFHEKACIEGGARIEGGAAFADLVAHALHELP